MKKTADNAVNQPTTKLSDRDRIAIAGAMALGKSYIAEAFLMARNITTTNPASLATLQSRWWASEDAKAFRQQVLSMLTRVAVADGEDLRSRSGIINELINATKQTSGRDSVQALQTLAKLQGFDRPGEGEGRELRRFYLPYKSDCRRCKLMEIYQKIMKKNGIKE